MTTRMYTGVVGGLLRVSAIVLVVYVGLLGVTYWSIGSTPKGFIPLQDMGYLMCSVQLPDAASKERTEEVMARLVDDRRERFPGVKHVTGVCGQSFVLNAFGSNFGSMFVNLDDYADRRDAARSADSIANQLRAGARADSGGADLRVRPAACPRRGSRRRLHDDGRGPRRRGPQGLQEETENLVKAGNADARAWWVCPPCFAPTSRRSTSKPIRASAWPRASRCRVSPTRCRSSWARCTSTISTCSAAPGRSTCRPISSSATRSKS